MGISSTTTVFPKAPTSRRGNKQNCSLVKCARRSNRGGRERAPLNMSGPAGIIELWGPCTKSPGSGISLCPLCRVFARNSSTTETQRTQRLHREERDRDFLCKAYPHCFLTTQNGPRTAWFQETEGCKAPRDHRVSWIGDGTAAVSRENVAAFSRTICQRPRSRCLGYAQPGLHRKQPAQTWRHSIPEFQPQNRRTVRSVHGGYRG